MAATPSPPPILTGLRAWTLLEEVSKAWASALLREGPEESSAIGVLHSARVPYRGEDARRNVLLDSTTCEFRRGSADLAYRRVAYFVVAGRGILQDATSEQQGIERIWRREIGVLLWVAAAPVHRVMPPDPGGPRPVARRVYEGRFGDGEINWTLEGQKTFDLFCLLPQSVRNEFEAVLRPHPHLRFLVR